MTRVTLFSVALIALFGCTADYQDGRYRCGTTADCPPGLVCYVDRCYHNRPNSDGGPLDAPSVDSDLPPVDANCGAIGCATIRTTNAWSGGPQLPPFTLNGVQVPALNFGQTSDDVQVPLTDASSLTLMITGLGSMTVAVPSGPTRYTVIVSEPAVAGAMMPTTTILENNFSGAATTTIRYGSAIHGGGTFGFDRAGATGTFTDFSRIATETVLADTTDPIALNSGSTMVAAFEGSSTMLPRMPGSGYYAVFAGRLDRSLVSSDGLRLILAIPGTHLLQSIPLFWLLNGSDIPVDLCRLTDLVPVSSGLGAGQLSGPVLAVPVATGGYDLTVIPSGPTPCDPVRTSYQPFNNVAPGPQRHLAIVMPDFHSADSLTVAVAAEPADPVTHTPAAAQSIRVENMAAFNTAFGTWSGTSFAQFPATSMHMTAEGSTAFLATQPTMVATRMDDGGGGAVINEYSWALGSPGATNITFAIASYSHAAVHSLWRVDAPYGAAWTATHLSPTATH